MKGGSAVVVILCSALAARAEGPAAMTATFVEGAVTVRPAGAEAPKPLAVGDVLHAGEMVETSSAARAEITFSNGSLLRLGEGSRMTLGGEDPAGSRFSARLFVGNVWAKVRKLLASNEIFQVETENGVAGVRGTEFRVEASPATEDVVRVYEGVVEVKGARGWAHRIEPGHELLFHRERPPAGPRRFDPASERGHRFMSWVRSRPERVVAPVKERVKERKKRKKQKLHEREWMRRELRGLKR